MIVVSVGNDLSDLSNGWRKEICGGAAEIASVERRSEVPRYRVVHA